MLTEALEKMMSEHQMLYLALVDASGGVRGEVGDRAFLEQIDAYGSFMGSAKAISHTIQWVWNQQLTPRASTNGRLTLVVFKISSACAAMGVIDGEPKFPFRYGEMVEVERALRGIAEAAVGGS